MKAAVVLLAFLACASATIFLTRNTVPYGWTRSGLAPATEKVNFMIALKQRNLAALDRLFWAVSDPQSPEYQNYMSIDEILDVVAPEDSVAQTVTAWLKSNNIHHIINTRDCLEVHTHVKHASALFNTDFHIFIHEDGRRIVRSFGDASMPDEIFPLVDMVEGISTFPMKHLGAHVRNFPADNAGATQGVIPETLDIIYQIPAQTDGSAPNTSVGVIEFQGESYAPSDLANWAKEVKITITPITKAHTVGPNDPTDPQLESTLDIEMVASLNDAAEAWFWLESGNGWLYQFVNHFFTTVDVPNVASISYGWSESDQCDIDQAECLKLGVNSEGYVERVNAEFQKIALRGISILVASGDSGANGRTDPDCTLPYLKPDYPAACPYITSVGATQLDKPTFALPNPPPICTGQGYSCPSGGTEVSVSYAQAEFASGGGFSNYAPMPSYQQTVVENYLATETKLPPASYFNKSNRAYPDVAAIGSAVLIYQGGVQAVGGTSCSAPEFAGVVSILNQYAIKKTGAPLGFLNPFLYQMAAAQPDTFHDITVGNNLCTEDGCSPSCKGYYCAVGWDPVSGLGSPNTANMIAYINANL